MPTTRRRVNLTLTEMEERFLDAIAAAGTAEQDAVLRYLESQALGTAVPGRSMTAADVVHVLMRMGIDRLEYELGEISYAAEAAAYTAEDLARIDALQRYHLAHIARSERSED